MRLWFQAGFLVAILALAGLAGAQSAPFRVKPSDVDSGVKDPSKELKATRTIPVATPRSNASSTAKDLQSIEHETAKATGSPSTKKTSTAAFKPQKDASNPKINIKGSGESKSVPTRVATDSYKGRLKQKGSHSTNH
jgi:hypothetical protein